jgi:hypothetical protein
MKWVVAHYVKGSAGRHPRLYARLFSRINPRIGISKDHSFRVFDESCSEAPRHLVLTEKWASLDN